MLIKPIRVLKDNYVWTIVFEDSNNAVIVDPGSASEVLKFLQQHQLNLKAILITHHHYDHTDGIVEIASHYPDLLVYGPKHKTIAGVNKLVSEGDEISLPNLNFHLKLFDIPGHTLSHIAYYGNGVLFCGDTLFSAGCGRLFEGTPEQMVASLQKLLSLNSATAVYCAHEYTLNNLRFAEMVEPNNRAIQARKQEVSELIAKNLPSLPSTLAIEKNTNPFLRLDEKDVFASAQKYAGKRLTDPVVVFKYLREWKDNF